MKKLLLLFLVFNFGFAQISDVEIRLVNASVGTSLIYNSNQLNEYTTSNDAGLNLILNNYNATSYILKAGHPYQPYGNRMISIPGVFPAQFITDLIAYSSVIESVKISDTNTFSDAVSLKLISITNGSSTGYVGGIATTNDSGLNAIFLNFNVFYYELLYPSGSSSFLNYYSVVCNCDKNLLKTALDNYTSIIESTQYAGAVYLGTNDFKKQKTTISPNPFSDSFNIETENIISNYSLFDVSGKQIVSTNLKAELDSKSQQLNSGFYFLNLTFDNGQIANYKLVKK